MQFHRILFNCNYLYLEVLTGTTLILYDAELLIIYIIFRSSEAKVVKEPELIPESEIQEVIHHHHDEEEPQVSS